MHKAGVGKTVEIVVSESFAILQGVGFGNSKTGAGDFGFNAETFGETADKSSFAGANIADEFDNSVFGCR